MTDHNLFYYPYASLTNTQLPLLKVAALYFDTLIILDPVGASWDTIGAEHVARDAVGLLKNAGILEIITPATVLTKYEASIADAIRADLGDRDFLELCEAQSRAGRFRSPRCRRPCRSTRQYATFWAISHARCRGIPLNTSGGGPD